MGKPKEGKNDLLRDAFNTFGTNAIGSVLSLLSVIIVMPKLDPSVKALITQNQMIGGGLFTLLGFSVNSSVMFYVARYRLKNVRRAIKKLMVVLAVFIAAAGALMILLFRDSFFGDTATVYCVAMVAYGVFALVSNILAAVLRGENKFGVYNMIILLQKVLTVLFTATVILWPTALVVVLSSLLVMLVSIAISYASIRKISYADSKPDPERDTEVSTGALVRYSLKSHVSNVLTFANTNLSSLILKGYSGLADFGIASTASTLVQQIWIVPDAVSVVIMSRLAAMNKHEDKLRLTLFCCKLVAIITFVCLIGLLVVARLLFPLIFPKYVAALAPMYVLAVGAFFIVYAKVLNNSIAAYGRPELNILPTALGAVANVALSFVLIPQLLVTGAALATSIALTTQGVVSMIMFCVFTKTPLYRLIIFNREELATLRAFIPKKRGGR